MISAREIWEALEMIVMAFQAIAKGDRETADRFLTASSEVLGPGPARFPGGLGKTEIFWK